MLTGHPAWLVLWIVFDLDTPISLLLVICLLVLLFAVSVVGCLLGYSSCLVVWIPLFLDPSDGAFLFLFLFCFVKCCSALDE